MRTFIVFIFVCLSWFACAQSYTVETVPNTKLVNNSFVSNPDGLLQESTVSQINNQLKALEDSATAQVAVVMLNSIGEASEVDFAQQLFQLWGIGQADKDNGLLILYVQDQRVIRFHTGYGLEGVLPDVICKRIQRDVMVPRFKEGDTDGGMLAGIAEAIKIISNPAYATEIKSKVAAEQTSWMTDLSGLFILIWIPIGLWIYFANRHDNFSNSPGLSKATINRFMSSGQWWLFIYFMPIAWIGLLAYMGNSTLYWWGIYGYLLFIQLFKYVRVMSRANQWIKRKEYPLVKKFLDAQGAWIGNAIFFPIPFIFLAIFFNKRKKTIRHYPRQCSECQSSMRLLSEKEEDKYLDKNMLMEENLKSVDYDVWVCTKCDAVAMWPYVNAETQYTACPSCKAVALSTLTKTLKKATTSLTGKAKEIQSCKNCGYKKEKERTLPKLVDTPSYEPSSSSSSSGSSWSSSSSSDSGGSWGGGSSGGGGSSSRW